MGVQDVSRAEVNKLISQEDFYTGVREDWFTVKGKISEWFERYKEFEKGDTFEDAFEQRRMTARFVKQTEPIKNMSAWNRAALEPAIVATKQTRVGVNPETLRPIYEDRITRTKVPEAQFKETGHMLDTTIEGLCLRMAPENFAKDGVEKRFKYDLGLHDLSACLLTPSRNISLQVFNKSLEAGTVIAFMPLPPQEDMKLYHQLNELAKGFEAHKNADFMKLMSYIRSRMTRVKLACERDISANFVNVAPDDHRFPKYKYGIGVWTKVKENGIEKTKYVGQDEVIRRKRLAREYQLILNESEDTKLVNEMIVAYRHHENPSFPLFTRLVVETGHEGPRYSYRTFKVGERSQEGRLLSDKGRFIGI